MIDEDPFMMINFGIVFEFININSIFKFYDFINFIQLVLKPLIECILISFKPFFSCLRGFIFVTIYLLLNKLKIFAERRFG